MNLSQVRVCGELSSNKANKGKLCQECVLGETCLGASCPDSI